MTENENDNKSPWKMSIGKAGKYGIMKIDRYVIPWMVQGRFSHTRAVGISLSGTTRHYGCDIILKLSIKPARAFYRS